MTYSTTDHADRYYVIRCGTATYLGIDNEGFVMYTGDRSLALKFYAKDFAEEVAFGLSASDDLDDLGCVHKIVKVVRKKRVEKTYEDAYDYDPYYP